MIGTNIKAKIIVRPDKIQERKVFVDDNDGDPIYCVKFKFAKYEIHRGPGFETHIHDTFELASLRRLNDTSPSDVPQALKEGQTVIAQGEARNEYVVKSILYNCIELERCKDKVPFIIESDKINEMIITS